MKDQSAVLGVGTLANVPYAEGCDIVYCAFCEVAAFTKSSFLGKHTCTKKKNRSKASSVVMAGERFDSLTEARRWAQLKYLEQKGVIQSLERQPKFPFVHNDVKISEYRADFRYMYDGSLITEDVKGYRTDTFKLKMKLMKAFYPFVHVILVRV